MVIITSPPLSVANMGYFFKLKATALVIFCIYNYAFFIFLFSVNPLKAGVSL